MTSQDQYEQLVVVIGLVRNNEEKILLQKRYDPRAPEASGKWEFPGGRIEFKETPEQALIRECKEETGCDVSIKHLIPLARNNRWTLLDGTKRSVIVICYEAQWESGEPRALDKKVTNSGWFTKEEILEMDTLASIKEFINFNGSTG